MTNGNGLALEGLRVVEIAEGISGPYCGKLLADMGAEVIKVERPRTGDRQRYTPPFYHDEPSPDTSLMFNFLNTNKLGLTMDIDQARGRELLHRLLEDADVLLVDGRPSQIEERGLGFEELNQRHPRLVCTYVSPFGLTGPYKDRKINDLVSQQMSAMGVGTPRSRFGPPDRRPLSIGGNQALIGAGLASAVATMHALFAREASGRGQQVDVSQAEPMASYQFLNVNRWVYTGDDGSRGFGEGARRFWCKDGPVAVMLFVGQEQQWVAFQEMLGNPEWIKDPAFHPPISDPATRDLFWAKVSEWAGDYTREEVYRKAQALRVPLFPINSVADAVESDQVKARGFIQPMPLANGEVVPGPSAPYIFSETPAQMRRSAPTLGRDNRAILCDRLGLSNEELLHGYQAGLF